MAFLLGVINQTGHSTAEDETDEEELSSKTGNLYFP